jgi:Superinfection immunity protein
MESAVAIDLVKTVVKALLITAAYALPALLAFYRRHGRAEAIAILNLLLGWTVVGWLAALAWALRSRTRGSSYRSYRRRAYRNA